MHFALSRRSMLPIAGLLPLTSAPEDEVAFAPAAGSSVTKTLRETTAVVFDEGMSRMGDVEQPKDELEIELRNTVTLAFTDRYGEVAGGRPLRLQRTFDQLRLSTDVKRVSDGDERTAETPAESALEGLTVRFDWSEDDEEYTVSYAGDEGGDSELLAGLAEDTDLRRLLPGEEVDQGEEWEAPVESIRGLLKPSGELHFVPAPEEGVDMEAIVLAFFFRLSEATEELGGSVDVRYAGTETLDEVEVAVFELEVELDASRDITDALPELAYSAGVEDEELDALSRGSIAYQWEGEGRMAWDLEAGRVHSASLSGDVSFEFEVQLEQERYDETIEFSMEMSFSGTSEISLETESD